MNHEFVGRGGYSGDVHLPSGLWRCGVTTLINLSVNSEGVVEQFRITYRDPEDARNEMSRTMRGSELLIAALVELGHEPDERFVAVGDQVWRLLPIRSDRRTIYAKAGDAAAQFDLPAGETLGSLTNRGIMELLEGIR